VTCLCVSLDGRYLFSGGGVGGLKCWDVERGGLRRDYGRVFEGEISAMAFLERVGGGG
jgi:hypothetical protein